MALSLPVELAYLPEDRSGVVEARDVGRSEQLAQEDDISKSDRYAIPSEGVAHIQR